MRQAFVFLLALLPLAPTALQAAAPFAGRWDFNLSNPGGIGANWLGVTEKGAELEVWFQPSGGNVYKVPKAEISANHLLLTLSRPTDKGPVLTWDLTVSDGKLTGVQKRGDKTTELTGVRAPALRRHEPKAWGAAEALFNGKDLTGWEPIGDPANSHWVVQDGLLINTEHGDNLKSKAKFEDFQLHFEANCPDRANSGFYLRGRYELQLENEPAGTEPPERMMGSIYGRIAPSPIQPRRPGEWESFDVTLVGRTVTVLRNGVMTINHKEIEGITGGALDANEGEPGPFYIQGDHTGGLKFRNITVSVPKR